MKTSLPRLYNMSSTQRSLLALPDEILFLIVEQLENCRKDLSAFACTCIRLSEIADPCCYRRVLIKSEDQGRCLLKAVQRKPWRYAFIRELMLVPSIEHARNLMDSLYFVLEVMHRVQYLTVELPFHSNSSIAASLKLKYRYRFGDLFEAASIISCIAKPRAFQGLRSCEYYLLTSRTADIFFKGVLRHRSRRCSITQCISLFSALNLASRCLSPTTILNAFYLQSLLPPQISSSQNCGCKRG